MTNDTILHIPMSRTIRQRLDAKAKQLGYGSAQTYMQMLAQAEAGTTAFSSVNPVPSASNSLSAEAHAPADTLRLADLLKGVTPAKVGGEYQWGADQGREIDG